MNKRLIVFISVIGMIFLSSQLFFGYRDLKKYKTISLQQKSISEDLGKYLVNVGLSLVDWSVDNQEVLCKKDSKAVCFGNFLFLLEKNSEACKEALWVDNHSWSHVSNVTLGMGRCSLYQKQPLTTEPIKAFIPVDKEAVPVVCIEYRKNYEPYLFKGEYKNGKISNGSYSIYGNTLVFYLLGKECLPVGLYDPGTEKLTPLELSENRAVFVGLGESSFPNHQNNMYVLQNNYLQLVLSPRAASIEGINLPFLSEFNKSSVVKEIEVDREIQQQVPGEASFPGFPYYINGNHHLEKEQSLGGFYPLLRRGIISNSDRRTPQQYQALNVVSYHGLETGFVNEFTVQEFSSDRIVFISKDQKLRKEFVLDRVDDKEYVPYCFSCKIDHSESGLWITSGIPEVELMSNSFVPSIKCISISGNKESFSKLKLPKLKHPFLLNNYNKISWIVNSNGYFGIILTPLTSIPEGYRIAAIPGKEVPTRLSVIDEKYSLYPASKYNGYNVALPLPVGKGENVFRVYAGPLDASILNKVDSIYFDSVTHTGPNYSESLKLTGIFSFISQPFAQLLFFIMKLFWKLTGSWGIAIILLTVFLRLVLYPLNAWSIKSMRRMQLLSPYIQNIQQKYKKEPKKAQMEIMALYKENKVNPLTGCFPIIIQIPFLIAMFDLLKTSFPLRGSSFIPGWINNLTSPDVIFQWSKPIFFLGTQLHLLPILLGLVMFLQQKISMIGKKVSDMTDQQRQQQAMGTMMTVLFTLMFYNFPSGLNLYWLSSMLLGIIQQWITNKILDKKHLKNEVVVKIKK